MTDLAQWLTAQLDADERIARAAAERVDPDWGEDDEHVYSLPHGYPVAFGSMGGMHGELRAHIAAHDPARVLREVEAKRGIVRAYETALAAFNDSGPAMADYDRLTGSVSSLRGVLELLVTAYEDRPGFKEEWRP